MWVYVVVLIAWIFIFNIGFNILLYVLGREIPHTHTHTQLFPMGNPACELSSC